MNYKEILKKVISKGKSVVSNVKNKDTSFFILALCVCIISTSIIWTYSNKNNNNPNDISLENNDKNDNNDNDDYRKDTSMNATALMDDYIRRIKEEYNRNLQKEIEEQAPDLYDIAAPLAGKVIKEYSVDNLVYFDTLEEWRVHTGIDIAPKDSLVVYSAYSGKVEKINKDTLMGVEIIINHGGGVKTLYSCLSVYNVKEGDNVKKGDQIGKIGQCVGIEMSEGPHLHFEIRIDENTVNPLDYFPKEEN